MLVFRRTKILNKLTDLAMVVRESTETLRDITLEWDRLDEGSARMEQLEHEADEKVHSISDDIDRFFILPLDKEDLSRLTESLDDVIDSVEQVANRLKIFRMSNTNPDLQAFASLIVEAAEQIHKGVLLIVDRKMQSKEYIDCFTNLERLENEGDRLHRRLLEKLMGPNPSDFDGDLLKLLKWKEIFQTLEDTLDRCEDIAVIFSRLKTKYK